MNFYSLYHIIDTIAVFTLVLLSIFFFTLKHGEKRNHRILGFALLAYALSYMDGVFLTLGYRFHLSYSYIIHATMSFDFLIGPLLYLYVQSRIHISYQIKRSALLLFIPFTAHFLLLFSIYFYQSLLSNDLLLNGKQIFSASQVLWLTSLSNLHYGIYIVAIIYTLISYQGKIKQQYSNIHKKNMQWLLIISCGLLAGGLLRYANNLWWLEAPYHEWHNHIDLKLFAVMSVMIFAIAVLFQSLTNQEILQLETIDSPAKNNTSSTLDKNEHLPPHDSPSSSKNGDKQAKYLSSALDNKSASTLLEELQKFMGKHKPYLDPELSLASLSQQTGITQHNLSQVINTMLGKNYYDFINDYRISESQKLLRYQGSSKNISQIMYESGFSSKSVFNTAFKKKVGQTPSQYRKLVTTLSTEVLESA